MGQRPAKRHVIAILRLEAGLTQTHLGKRLGYAGINIQQIEQGLKLPSKDLALRAAEFFGVPVDWIIANNPMMPRSPEPIGWSPEPMERKRPIAIGWGYPEFY